MVHSEADYEAAVEASNILFGNSTSEQLHKLDEDTLLAVFEGVPELSGAQVRATDLRAGAAMIIAGRNSPLPTRRSMQLTY